MDTFSRDIFSVSRLTAEVRATLENSFPLLWVEGEVSNLSTPRSGHLYFTLKDSGAQVRCALFRNRRNHLRHIPSAGEQILVRARISLYEPRGDFQLIVEHLEPSGAGALAREFEQLKVKLEAEGLFDQARKRTLPRYPQRIGLITSPSGAALQDILQVIARRAPWIEAIVYPTAVQGATAAAEVRKALALAARRRDCELLILARGGGAIEDLASFNNEELARAIAASPIPLISAIGHEIDFTIADFVADRRAPTPSAAAELATPDREELHTTIASFRARLVQHATRRLEICRQRSQTLTHRLGLLHPERQLRQQEQRIDGLELRLQRTIVSRLAQAGASALSLEKRLRAQTPRAQLRRAHELFRGLRQRLHHGTTITLSQRREALQVTVRNLHIVSPLGTLARGYAIARLHHSGELLRSSTQATPGDLVDIKLDDGALRCEVCQSPATATS